MSVPRQQKLHILPTRCSYVFCASLRNNVNLLPWESRISQTTGLNGIRLRDLNVRSAADCDQHFKNIPVHFSSGQCSSVLLKYDAQRATQRSARHAADVQPALTNICDNSKSHSCRRTGQNVCSGTEFASTHLEIIVYPSKNLLQATDLSLFNDTMISVLAVHRVFFSLGQTADSFYIQSVEMAELKVI